MTKSPAAGSESFETGIERPDCGASLLLWEFAIDVSNCICACASHAARSAAVNSHPTQSHLPVPVNKDDS